MEQELQHSDKSEDSSGFDIKAVLYYFLLYWPWFILSLFIFISCSFIYLRYTPKIYNTHAKIKILDENSGIELPTTALVVNRSNINLENEIEILTSYPILEHVVNRLGLCAQFYQKGRVKSKPIVKLPFDFELTQPFDSIFEVKQFLILVKESGFQITDVNKSIDYDFPDFDTTNSEHDLPFELTWSSEFQKHELMGRNYEILLVPKKQAILNLKSKIKIETIGELSHLLNLSMKGQNVKISERILNTLIDVFNQDDILDRQLIWKRTIDFVDERFVNLSMELDSIESNKKNFKIDNRLVDVSTDGFESLQQRKETEEALFQLENQIAVSNSLIKSLSNAKNSYELLPANIGVENPGINSLLQEFNTLVLERQKFISSAGVINPMVIHLNERLNNLKININRSISAYINQLNITKDQLSLRNQTFQSEVSRIPEKELQLRAIERQQSIKERLFIFLLQKKEEASVNLAVTEPTLKVVEYSISDTSPISPNSRNIYLGALLLGLLLPLEFFILFFYWTPKFITNLI